MDPQHTGVHQGAEITLEIPPIFVGRNPHESILNTYHLAAEIS